MKRHKRYRQLERVSDRSNAMKWRTKKRRERKNKIVHHVNNGLVSTLSRAERKIRHAFDSIQSDK